MNYDQIYDQPWLVPENLERVTMEEFKRMSAYRQERHLDVAIERALKLNAQAEALLKWRQAMMAHFQPGKDSKP